MEMGHKGMARLLTTHGRKSAWKSRGDWYDEGRKRGRVLGDGV